MTNRTLCKGAAFFPLTYKITMSYTQTVKKQCPINLSIDFALAGIHVDLNPDLLDPRWRKLVWNIPFSGLTTLFRIDTAQVVNNPHLQKLAEDLMYEVADGALMLGR